MRPRKGKISSSSSTPTSSSTVMLPSSQYLSSASIYLLLCFLCNHQATQAAGVAAIVNDRIHHQQSAGLAIVTTEALVPSSADKSQELANFPITYGLYRPSFLNNGYGLVYDQGPPQSPSWADPAKRGMATPGWTKYLYEYTGGRKGEFQLPALTYGPRDYAAVSAWLEQACPSSYCRSMSGKEGEHAPRGEYETMSSQPNTESNFLQFKMDHYSWFYVLARAATQNGVGQVLKLRTEVDKPTYDVLRNMNGPWERNVLKGGMDADLLPFDILRGATNQHMRDRLRGQLNGYNTGYGLASVISPFPTNHRYKKSLELGDEARKLKVDRNVADKQQQEETGDKQQKRQLAHVLEKKVSLKQMLGKVLAEKGRYVEPVITPAPIDYGPNYRVQQKYKPVVQAYYHNQVYYPKPQKSIPIVFGNWFKHPKLAAKFNGPPMDYEHALCNQGYCPGRRDRRRRTKEHQELQGDEEAGRGTSREEREEQQQQREQEEGEVKVLVVDMTRRSYYDSAEQDKGIFFHKEKKYSKPKIAKLIPEYRHYEYPKAGYTKLKPIHRVYQQPKQPAVFVIVPEKHPWLKKKGWYDGKDAVDSSTAANLDEGGNQAAALSLPESSSSPDLSNDDTGDGKRSLRTRRNRKRKRKAALEAKKKNKGAHNKGHTAISAANGGGNRKLRMRRNRRRRGKAPRAGRKHRIYSTKVVGEKKIKVKNVGDRAPKAPLAPLLKL